MKRRKLLSLIGLAPIWASLPKQAKAYNPDIFLPKGTEFREDGTNDLICTLRENIIPSDIMKIEQFDWAWQPPRPGQDMANSTFYRAMQQARKTYKALA